MFGNFNSLKGERLVGKASFVLVCLSILILSRYLLFLFAQELNKLSPIKLKEAGIEVSTEIELVHFILIMPILEELIYRLPLRFKKESLKVSLILASLLKLFYLDLDYLFTSPLYVLWIRIVALIIIIYGINSVLNREEAIKKIEVFWKNHFNFVLLSLLTLFALGHLNRFEISSSESFVTALMMLPGFAILGLLFSYVRLKLGIVAAIVFHSFNNAIPYLTVLFMD